MFLGLLSVVNAQEYTTTAAPPVASIIPINQFFENPPASFGTPGLIPLPAAPTYDAPSEPIVEIAPVNAIYANPSPSFGTPV